MRRSLAPIAGVILILVALPHGAVGGPGAGLGPRATHYWTQLSPASAPSPRDMSVAAYDPLLKETVLFGGYDVSIFAYNDTWVFHGGSWKNVTTSSGTAPGARWAAALEYDPALHGLVLFGGRDTVQFYNDLWLFNGTGWHNITPSAGPSPRSGIGMAFDANLSVLIVYGGGIGNLPVGSGSAWTFYNETWVYKAGAWTNSTRPLGANPGERFDMRMAYDPHLREIVAYGGDLYHPATGTGAYVSDTWVLSSGHWKKLPTTSPPAGNEAGSMTWFPQCRCLVYFGAGAPAPVGNETWLFSGSGVWKNLTPALLNRPAARANVAFAADTAAGELVLFGGDEASVGPYAYDGDTWAFK